MKSISFRLAIVTGLLLGAGTPRAEPLEIIARIRADDLADLLSRIGFFAVAYQEGGEQIVVPVGFFNQPIKSEVRLQECTAQGCARLLFTSWPKRRPDQSWINSWNRSVPAGLVKTSLLKDGTLHLQMEVDLEGGVSRQFVEQSAFAFVTLANRVFPGNGLN